MAAFNFIHSYDKHCDTQRARGLLRDLNPKSVISQGLIDFSSNDYLGLSRDQRLLAAAQQAGETYGVGATGSRLLSGDSMLFHEFEARIARDKKTAAALIFNSGYQANSAVLAALCDKRTLGQEALVFFDKYNHASLYHGCFLADATLLRYRHNDIAHLAQLLAHYESDLRPKMIVSETVFGMDGDIADVAALIALCKKHHALLYLDEAHATGLWGEHGYGVSTLFDLTSIPHVIMGTFSKALGCAGGYIACDDVIKKYLINQCGGFIYSTAPSPLVIGAAYEAWKYVADLQGSRARIFANAQYLREQFQALGLNTGLSNTHIIPLILEDEEKVVRYKNALLEAGIVVSAIRPPTVPPKTARLRVAVNATHTQADLDTLLEFFQNISLGQKRVARASLECV